MPGETAVSEWDFISYRPALTGESGDGWLSPARVLNS